MPFANHFHKESLAQSWLRSQYEREGLPLEITAGSMTEAIGVEVRTSRVLANLESLFLRREPSARYAFMSLQRFAMRPKIQRAMAEMTPMTAKGIQTLAFTW